MGVTVTISKGTPVVSINPVILTYGTPLANSQLSGTATWTVGGNQVTVPGSWSYTTATGTVPVRRRQSERVGHVHSDGHCGL